MGSAVKSAIAGKSEKADKLKNSAKRGFGRRTENKAEQSPAIGLKSTNKAVSADNKTGTKKKLQKGDLLVRAASVAGIFILAFLLFSDQIKFNKISSDVTESGSEILSSLLNETDAVQAGADSVYIVSGDEESTAGIGEENSGAENGMGGSGLENGTENNNGETGAESNGVEVGNSSAEVGNSSAEVGNSSAEVGNSSAEIGNSSAEVGSSSAEVGGNSAEAGTGESSAEVASGSDTGSMAENVDSSYVFPLRYLVKKGDSLYAISEKYYGDTTMVDAICQANDITDPSQLRYGTVLILPSR
jgi:nucleoid-associated protein YgaU